MAAMIEDNISLDYIKGNDTLGDAYIVPDFVPAARDIMQRFPRTPWAPFARPLAPLSAT